RGSSGTSRCGRCRRASSAASPGSSSRIGRTPPSRPSLARGYQLLMPIMVISCPACEPEPPAFLLIESTICLARIISLTHSQLGGWLEDNYLKCLFAYIYTRMSIYILHSNTDLLSPIVPESIQLPVTCITRP